MVHLLDGLLHLPPVAMLVRLVGPLPALLGHRHSLPPLPDAPRRSNAEPVVLVCGAKQCVLGLLLEHSTAPQQRHTGEHSGGVVVLCGTGAGQGGSGACRAALPHTCEALSVPERLPTAAPEPPLHQRTTAINEEPLSQSPRTPWTRPVTASTRSCTRTPPGRRCHSSHTADPPQSGRSAVLEHLTSPSSQSFRSEH